jgi:hypothetical protein
MLGADPAAVADPAGALGVAEGGAAEPRAVALGGVLGVAAAPWLRPEMSR